MMGDPIRPRPKRAPRVERFEAAPELEVNVLQQVTPLLGVSLVSASETRQRGFVLCHCVLVQLVATAHTEGSRWREAFLTVRVKYNHLDPMISKSRIALY